MTLAELKSFISTLPDIDPNTGDPYEVWMEVGDGLSSEVNAVYMLNQGDILLTVNDGIF